MRRECRKRFPRHRLQRKLLASDPDMHHGTCVTHVPWCMSGSLNRSGGENVPGIPGACATRNFTYLARGPWYNRYNSSDVLLYMDIMVVLLQTLVLESVWNWNCNHFLFLSIYSSVNSLRPGDAYNTLSQLMACRPFGAKFIQTNDNMTLGSEKFSNALQWRIWRLDHRAIRMLVEKLINPDSKVRGAHMGPIWGRQDPGGTHVGPMNFVIWEG